jgi:thymidylate synthase
MSFQSLRSGESLNVLDVPYIKLVKHVLENGKKRKERTGTDTISCFGQQIRFNISENVPLLTTKKMAWRSCIIELLWFLRGDTNTQFLKQNGVNIWNANTTREYLDKNNKPHLKEGDIGAGYGFQWRNFGGNYGSDTPNGFDQINYVINEIKTNPKSRRIFMSAWNPIQMKDMALPPCHVSCQFYVDENDIGEPEYLSCHLYQRSVDCFLGLPFNIFSYTVLTYIIAEICDLKPKELIISTGDTHIYKNHIEQMRIQIEREPYISPKLKINPSIKTKKIEEITLKDIELTNYSYHPVLFGEMSA